MTPAPWPAGAVCEHWIRPGLLLSWGADFPSRSLPGDAVALFCFVIGRDPDRAADRMFVARPAACDRLADSAAPCAFHATIAFSSTAAAELASGAPPLAELLASLRPSALAPAPTLALTSVARLAVESIRRCPFVGPLREMALTARGNDLLVEFLTALSAAERPRPAAPLLGSMTAQVQAAADLLAQRLEHPPALAALARCVGLSETSLKRGFRQLFATTVFGYLRARRMERARVLLESGAATVLEAAALVGYSNPSNFAAAFRRHFGVNPKEFQLGARR